MKNLVITYFLLLLLVLANRATLAQDEVDFDFGCFYTHLCTYYKLFIAFSMYRSYIYKRVFISIERDWK